MVRFRSAHRSEDITCSNVDFSSSDGVNAVSSYNLMANSSFADLVVVLTADRKRIGIEPFNGCPSASLGRTRERETGADDQVFVVLGRCQHEYHRLALQRMSRWLIALSGIESVQSRSSASDPRKYSVCESNTMTWMLALIRVVDQSEVVLISY